MIHGIATGYDAFTSPEILWEHFKRVKALEDNIWVGTYCEVAAYVKERKNIQLDITKKKSSFKITPRLALDDKLFCEPLTMVVSKNGKSEIKVSQGKQELAVKDAGDKFIFSFDPHGEVIKISF